jgi:beta-N-acetylhexosaminidase
MRASSFITGLSATRLTADERAFLREALPWGLILFRRNVEDPAQVARLSASFREEVGWDAPVFIDQEGGRVQRLGPPCWPNYPPGAVYGSIYDRDCNEAVRSAKLGARLIAADLHPLGIDADCLPLGDLRIPGADSVIGDRAYGATPEKVAAIARAIAEGLLEGGVLPVLKHLPGHGRATADSHKRLPIVDAGRQQLELTDFEAFRLLSDLPLGMTAHVVFSEIDSVAPATHSVTIVREVIRGSIGFRGLLMTDDLSMGALSGSPAERSRAAYAAGCDVVLHCNGQLDEMEAVASEAPRLAGEAAARAAAALALRRKPNPFDTAAARALFAETVAAHCGTRVGP